MAIGDKIRQFSVAPAKDHQWFRGLRYAIMLEIEDFKDREGMRLSRSAERINALKGNERFAHRLSNLQEIMDLIAPLENEDPIRSAELGNELADYLLARENNPDCSSPNRLKGELLGMDLGL